MTADKAAKLRSQRTSYESANGGTGHTARATAEMFDGGVPTRIRQVFSECRAVAAAPIAHLATSPGSSFCESLGVLVDAVHSAVRGVAHLRHAESIACLFSQRVFCTPCELVVLVGVQRETSATSCTSELVPVQRSRSQKCCTESELSGMSLEKALLLRLCILVERTATWLRLLTGLHPVRTAHDALLTLDGLDDLSKSSSAVH